MFTCVWIFAIVSSSVLVLCVHTLRTEHVLNPQNITSCEEFERGAYFNPREIVDSLWKIIYFWARNTEITTIGFSLITEKKLSKFRNVVKTVESGLEIEWFKADFMIEPRPGLQIVMLNADTPGAYRALIKKEQRTKERPHPPPIITFADVRLKLVKNGRIIGMMSCEELTAYALMRTDEMPQSEEECLAAAKEIGFYSAGGQSYLNITKMKPKEEL